MGRMVLSMTKFKVKFKVEKTYDVEVEVDDSNRSIEDRNDEILMMIEDDYEIGNMDNNDHETSYAIRDVKEIGEFSK